MSAVSLGEGYNKTRSIYKADGKLHEQERDVAKYWKNGKIRIAFYGLENQTDIDKDMPLRLIGYDGAAYRAQLLEKREDRYPVVTLVLYFGLKRWNKPLSLKACLEIPKGLEEYVNNYKVNLYEIAYLTEGQVNMFQSDFRIVADYFTQIRKNKDYHPSTQTIRHVNEVLKLMAVLSQDQRFEEVMNSHSQKGEIKTMSDVLDRIEAKGMEKGRAEGIIRSVESLMKSTGLSAKEAMRVLDVPESIQQKFLEKQSEYQKPM